MVEVDFATEAVHDIATFDGDVYWLSANKDHALPGLRLVIADHSVEGVGRFPLLYTVDNATRQTTVSAIDAPFERVYEDEYGRAWLLPTPGVELSELHYISVASGRMVSVAVPLSRDGERRRFASVLQIPDGPFLVWGIGGEGLLRRIAWVAELAPPMFDDALWQESGTFALLSVPWTEESVRVQARKIRRGETRLSYDRQRGLVLLEDGTDRGPWVARPEMDRWVTEEDWRLLFLEELAPPLLPARPPSENAGFFGPAPAPPDDWPRAYLDRLLEEPARRIARYDPDEPTNPLIQSLLEDVLEVQVETNVHVSASGTGAWVLGLDNGIITHPDPETGRFVFAHRVPGVPVAVAMHFGEAETKMVIDYVPSDMNAGGYRQRRLVLERDGWAEQSDIKLPAEHLLRWTDRLVTELLVDPGDRAEVVWTDLMTDQETTTIEADDGLYLVGLLAMPDGRVLGYGTDGAGERNAPVLVDVARGRGGIVWHRDIGHLCEQHPLPETGITHAAYIPEARRVLLVADGKAWSVDPGLRDWRQELAELPAGFGEEVDGDADE